MTKLEAFEKVKPKLLEAVHKAILEAEEKCPGGLAAFLGMTVNTTPEDPCDEEFMQTISGM